MDNTFEQSFTKAQQLQGISLGSFIASVSFSAIIFTLEVLAFLAIRKRFPDFYTTIPNHQNSTSESWKEYIATNLVRFDRRHEHFDRYFFRRYLRSLAVIFTPALILIPPILIPLNYTQGKTAVLGVSGLDALGWSNVGLDQADRYWAHLILGLLFIVHVCWVIWNELAFYVATWQSSPYAALCTVLIESIPDDWMSDKALTSQLEVFPGVVTAISFNRDYSLISRLAERRERLARSLEIEEISKIRKAYRAGIQKRDQKSNFTKKPRPASYKSRSLLNVFAWLEHEKVDTSIAYREELLKTSEEMEFYRAARERFPLLRSAFITFANPLAANMACQTVIHTSSGYMTPRTIPLSVDDVIWSNVNITWKDRTIRTVLSNTLIMATATACIIPVALAGLLSQIIYITRAVPWLSWINELPEFLLSLLQGVLPPSLVAVLMKGFVVVLEYLVKKQGISSKSHIDLKIQDYYFYFLFLQVTLVVSLSAGLTAIANEMKHGASLAGTLAKNLPKASNYFLSYILLQALSISANSLLRFDRLIGDFVLGPIFDKSATQIMTRRRGQDLQWGTFVPLFTNLSCIGSSSILTTERDHGGLFYPKAIKHLLMGLYLMQVCLIALFLLVRDSQGNAKCIGQACVMLFATGLTVVYHRLLCRAFDPLLSFSPTALSEGLAKKAMPSPPFLHKALTSIPVISIPSDDHGISSTRGLQLREELKGVVISDTDATITVSGKIYLN
ncbi:hypothetical protein COCSADRAFT_169357 [Bipolaris sorokiniana ND90Pr]|uniref:CSC1/OSCA1-like 7TM region domain-containing protein n=1 Tax=Cochliobolus sativus (strain ND90Pr / ATCC 201652) TaxID=665912 RepID=M2RI34_COCSN|nr:uncharacterized protein COCSADRAFT_169357 [Bipolaris sorokiniana ND90Pr]EMD66414.1 hypothetical protein COCSADRAFT_169357 [Bipolaris sorokiniana ND90Pr]